MRTKVKLKGGISLIVLVITIIVMIILAAAIILALSNAGIIGKSNTARNKNDIAVLKEKHNMMLSEKLLNGQSTIEFTEKEKEEILGDYKGKIDIICGQLMTTGNMDDDEKREINKQGIPDATNYNTNKKVNKPLLPEGNGIEAVAWSGATAVVKDANKDDWYNYSSSETDNTDKNWANMRTADGSYWVWIPRYAYKITSGYRGEGINKDTVEYYGTIDVKFLVGTSDIAVDGTKCSRGNIAGSDYVVHPAFTFGDVELEGIWVAKYKARSSSEVSEYNDISPDIVIKSDGKAWKNMSIGNIFTKCREMETKSMYGWSKTSSGINSDSTDSINNGIDTHLIKNVEWGAVAYLTTSNYGLKHNKVVLDSNNYYDIYRNELTSPFYGYPSTSGTQYGVYEMSGIDNEFVAAVNKNSNTGVIYGSDEDSKSLKTSSDKYKDIYLTTNLNSIEETVKGRKNYYGDATAEVMVETNVNNKYITRNFWYRDAFFLPSSGTGGCFIIRGGHSNGVSYSDEHSSGNSLSTYLVGIYASSYAIGGYRKYVGLQSFRPVLIVNSNL